MAELISPPGVKTPAGKIESTPLLPPNAENSLSTEPPGTTLLEMDALRAGVPVEVAAKMGQDQLDIFGDVNCGQLELGS